MTARELSVFAPTRIVVIVGAAAFLVSELMRRLEERMYRWSQR